uniref:Uncharacterized protein n=1 Tax=viral metagenome TaxID=1070528 RepID=A0A6M3LMZ4_9ZZZZ
MCPKCGSRLGFEAYYTPSGWVDSLHCKICSFTWDPVIEENKRQHPAKLDSSGRQLLNHIRQPNKGV